MVLGSIVPMNWSTKWDTHAHRHISVDIQLEWNAVRRNSLMSSLLAKEDNLSNASRQLCRMPYIYKLCAINTKSSINNNTVFINKKFIYSKQELQPGNVVILILSGCVLKGVKSFSTNKIQTIRSYLDQLPKGTYFIGLTSHPKANNTDVRGLLLLPKARRYGGLIGGDAPVTSVFIGRIGYWKQMVYKSTTKTGTGLSFQKDIYSGTRFNLTTEIKPFDRVLETHKDLTRGGSWTPPYCIPRYRVAVIVPFRQRNKHLGIFVENMIRFLKLQLLTFTIYIVEQTDGGWFNRAAMMNIGYLEASRDNYYDCFVFHDVDLIPEDLTNLYYCGRYPRHLAVTRSKNGYM
ncbi:hypothetical protein LSH36_1123g00053 [Paralvinella palmiformis]|uniref:Beta-1,4-galactosyltransferase n=1 Tax=Paralvinella palmiformis TaxID=53620 RepID=A0AAD9MPM0_9ANNE|nr:hypothetical protein LSH36_1123g00053 [Paralvinella palmiformis]